MKKLMLTAAAMAIVGSASAVTVYDYRATIRHPNLREVNVTVGGTQYKVYTKYVASTTLNGYLIQDEQATLNGGREDPAIMNAGGIATITGQVGVGNGVVQPENRCFLVAMNRAAGRYAYPRIVPGVLEAKWWNPNFREAGSVPVQAYLWLGGEVIAATDRAIGITGADQDNVFQVFGHKGWAAVNANPGEFHNLAFGTTALGVEGPANFPVAGALAAPYGNAGARISNYAFTSEYLFGQFNQKPGAGGQRFADCWLNGAGFGQSGSWDGGYCCGWVIQGAGMSINNLQGNLKGGISLCSVNGENWTHARLPYGRPTNQADGNARAWSRFDRQLWGDWDDQRSAEGGVGGAFDAPADPNQIGRANFNDLWVDGPFELGTTDCASGQFSLRRITQDMTVALDFAGAEAVLAGLPVAPAPGTAVAVNTWAGQRPSDSRAGALSQNDGTLELLQTIKGCMLALNRNARMCGTDLQAAPNTAQVPTALFGPAFYDAYLAQ